MTHDTRPTSAPHAMSTNVPHALLEIQPKTRLFSVRIRKPTRMVRVLPGRHRVLFGPLLKVDADVDTMNFMRGVKLEKFSWRRLRWVLTTVV